MLVVSLITINFTETEASCSVFLLWLVVERMVVIDHIMDSRKCFFFDYVVT